MTFWAAKCQVDVKKGMGGSGGGGVVKRGKGEYVDDPLTRGTIFSAFISSSGPTVQIISDIRKSFSSKSKNLMHSDALLAEKTFFINAILYFFMEICESRKSCLTQLAY